MITGAAPRGLIRRPRAMLRAGNLPAAGAAKASERLPLAILLALLPLFGQTFYYLVEFPLPYFLSKAWAFLMLPLSIYALVMIDLPYKALFGVLIAYVLGLTPLLSMIHLGNGFLDSLATTVKAWPFTGYFALAALLAWLRPAPATIVRACVILGALTFILMWLLWVLVPPGWYTSDPATAKLLLFEEERGYRIYMPMFFGILFVFYLARRLGQGWQWGVGLLLIGAFVTLAVIYKQRTSIMAALIVVAAIIIASMPASIRRPVIAVCLAAAAAGIAMFSGAVFERAVDSFGGSLSVRLRSIGTAIEFLGDDPTRWLFGVGATTRFGAVTLADIFGDQQFYLADIGWLGIVFEYGLLGALLLAGVYVAGIVFAWRTGMRDGNPLSAALGDYACFLLLSSAVYSVVFTPGELATIVAIAAYMRSVTPIPWSEPVLPIDSVNYQRIPAVLHAPARQKATESSRLPR